MIAFTLSIGFDLFLALAVMTGIWAFMNQENEKVIEIKKVFEDISSDASKLKNDLKLLRKLASEIVQPLLNSNVVDIESRALPDGVEDEKEAA